MRSQSLRQCRKNLVTIRRILLIAKIVIDVLTYMPKHHIGMLINIHNDLSACMIYYVSNSCI